MPKHNPVAGVDSGILLVIDPCYLPEVLHLTQEQEDAWYAMYSQVVEENEFSSTPASILVNDKPRGFLFNTPDGDGLYTPQEVAHMLLFPSMSVLPP